MKNNTENLSKDSSDFETYLLPDDICANNESSPILFDNPLVSNKLYCTHSAGGKIMVCEFEYRGSKKLIFYNMSNTIQTMDCFLQIKIRKVKK